MGDARPPPTSTLNFRPKRPAVLGGTALAVTYVSLLVLLPIAALISHGFSGGFGAFWDRVTVPSAVRAIEFSIETSLGVALINAVMGTTIAWMLATDRFFGRAFVNSLIDLPFALPTIVVSVTVFALYGPQSPIHLDVTGKTIGIMIALAFVTLPFSVRAVQPVIEARTFDAEQAAVTLGATGARTFAKVTLPAILPAILSGVGLSFARGVGEYGSLVLIANSLHIASIYIQTSATYDFAGAAAVSVVMLVLALVILVAVNWFSRRLEGRLQ